MYIVELFCCKIYILLVHSFVGITLAHFTQTLRFQGPRLQFENSLPPATNLIQSGNRVSLLDKSFEVESKETIIMCVI